MSSAAKKAILAAFIGAILITVVVLGALDSLDNAIACAAVFITSFIIIVIVGDMRRAEERHKAETDRLRAEADKWRTEAVKRDKQVDPRDK